jgi:hypothetical protein
MWKMKSFALQQVARIVTTRLLRANGTCMMSASVSVSQCALELLVRNVPSAVLSYVAYLGFVMLKRSLSPSLNSPPPPPRLLGSEFSFFSQGSSMNECLYFICKDTQTGTTAQRGKFEENWMEGEKNGTTVIFIVYLFSSKLRLRVGRSGYVFHFGSCRMNFHKISVLVKGLQDNLEIYRIIGQKVPDPAALSLTRNSCLFRRGIYNCSKPA